MDAPTSPTLAWFPLTSNIYQPTILYAQSLDIGLGWAWAGLGWPSNQAMARAATDLLDNHL